MKITAALFFRFVAVLTVIFCGITAVIPQSSVKDDDINLPVWSDIDADGDKDIIQMFELGIIRGGKEGEYGKDVPFTAAEAAYAAVRIKEYIGKTEYSFSAYNDEDGEKYIKKAKKYKLWDDSMPNPSESVSREQFSAVLARIGGEGDTVNDETGFADNAYTYKKELRKMYKCGIMLTSSASSSFSREIAVTREEAAKLCAVYLDPQRRVKIVMPDFESLKSILEIKMADWQGDWSLYFEDCGTEYKISINSHQVYSASLIKLFVAQTVYKKAIDGQIELTSKIEDEIRKMITYSDNEAWKYLAKAIGGGTYSRGMAEVTELAQNSGFIDTGQFYKGSHKNYNFTSVDDCGKYLRGILDGTIVNKEYSDKILDLLKQQQHVLKIPSGVPESVVTANKTGELDYVQGDAAIVYAPAGTYILVIIGDDLEDSYGQISKFTELSKIVYEFMNG